MKRLLIIFLLSIMFMVNYSPARDCDKVDSVIGGDEGWKLKKNKNGIKVYLRKTSISTAYTFRGVVELEANLETVVGLIWDGERYTDWLVLCNESKFIEVISETEQILYTMNEPVWPIAKRDSICRRKIFQDPETKSVTVEMCGIPEYIPVRKGRVRIPVLMGYGKVTPKEDGKVELVYEVLIEPGGWIPNGLANLLVVNVPFRTLRNIQDMMPLKKYQGTDISFIHKAPSKTEEHAGKTKMVNTGDSPADVSIQ